MVYRTAITVLTTCLLISNYLHSQVIVTEIDAEWTNVIGGQNVNGVGTNEIRWGVTNGQQSGYIFQSSPVVFPVTVGTPFSLGTFTHNNFSIQTPGITGATLTTNFTFLIDGNEVQV